MSSASAATSDSDDEAWGRVTGRRAGTSTARCSSIPHTGADGESRPVRMTGHQRPEFPGARDPSVVADGVIGAEFECLANLMVDASAGGTILVLRMLGEIDMTTQAQVDTALRDGLHSAPRHLLVDLSQIVFCGARGIAGFADTGRTAAGNHVGFALCGLTPRLNRLTMIWGPGYPTRHHSVEVALTEIRAAGALLE